MSTAPSAATLSNIRMKRLPEDLSRPSAYPEAPAEDLRRQPRVRARCGPEPSGFGRAGNGGETGRGWSPTATRQREDSYGSGGTARRGRSVRGDTRRRHGGNRAGQGEDDA